MRIRRAIAIMLLATLSWSCTNEGQRPAPEPPPPASPEPTAPEVRAAGEMYPSTDALVADLEKGGVDCGDLTPVQQKSKAVEASARCDPNHDPKRRMYIYVFTDADARERLMEAFTQSRLPLVVGPNWIVVVAGREATAEQRVELVRDATGGAIQQVES